MATTTPVDKSPKTIEWMAQTDPLREANTVKKINDRSILLSLSKITHYFKKWTGAIGVLKNIYCLYKNLMLQIDSLNSSCPQKQQYPKITLRLKALRKSRSVEKVAVLRVTLASANIYNCSSKIFTILYE